MEQTRKATHDQFTAIILMEFNWNHEVTSEPKNVLQRLILNDFMDLIRGNLLKDFSEDEGNEIYEMCKRFVDEDLFTVLNEISKYMEYILKVGEGWSINRLMKFISESGVSAESLGELIEILPEDHVKIIINKYDLSNQD